MKKILSLVFVVLVLISSTSMVISANANSVDSDILNYRSDFLWGQNMNTNTRGSDSPPQYSEEALHLAAQQGVKMIRYQANYIDGDFTEADQIIGLCNKYGIKVMLVIFPSNVDEPTQEDLDLITQTTKTYAERYNGKEGRAKVDYFQLWNELEIKLQSAKYGGGVTTGQSIDNFYTVSVPGKDDLVEWAKNMKAAAKGIREADTDAKIVINFSWVAFGCIRYYVQEGVDFDYIGWDYYPDTFIAEDVKLNFECALYGGVDSAGRSISGVREIFPDKEVIICESNTWVKGYASMGGYGDHNDTKMTLDTYQGFFEIMKLSYQQSWIKGFCAFKLTDMPSHGSESERHYGHIFVEKGGKIIGPKPIYYEYQRLIGGPNNVDRLSKDSIDLKPYDKFKVKTQDDTDINQNEPVINESINNDIAVDDTPIVENDISTDTEPIVETVIVKPDDIYKKTTSTVTHSKLPWALLISVGTGMLVLFGAGFATFLIIKKKKRL